MKKVTINLEDDKYLRLKEYAKSDYSSVSRILLLEIDKFLLTLPRKENKENIISLIGDNKKVKSGNNSIESICDDLFTASGNTSLVFKEGIADVIESTITFSGNSIVYDAMGNTVKTISHHYRDKPAEYLKGAIYAFERCEALYGEPNVPEMPKRDVDAPQVFVPNFLAKKTKKQAPVDEN